MMKTLLRLSALLIAFASGYGASGQVTKSVPGTMVSCPPGHHTGHHHVPMPAYIADRLQAAEAGLRDGDPCSEIIVNYSGFSPEAEAAFEYAKGIWEHAVVSSVPIIIDAQWTDLGEDVLGSAGPSTLFWDFAGAPDSRLYPTPLANAIAGTDLTSGGPHILANFNSEFTWYFGTDGNPPGDLFDFVSVVLHEIGHGLGFTTVRDYDVDTGVGTIGFGSPVLFSRYSENLLLGDGGTPLINLGDGVPLGNAFTSNNIYSASASAIAANGNNAPRYYAPEEYSSSSVAHWDESDFPPGNVHSLMSPQIGPGEAIHNPGPITLGLFQDMGWELCQDLEDQPCTDWAEPAPDQGWPNFNTTFGGAPCDDGSGCPFYEIQDFQVWAGEAYAVNNFIEGGTYTFSICNGPDAGAWQAEFTVIAPSGAVDAFGTTTECSLTWTASESGTYLIVINEAGNCGEVLLVENGWPALTCEGDAECIDTGCALPELVLDGPSVICQDQSTAVVFADDPEVPDGGGVRLRFLSTETGTGINLNSVAMPYIFDYDLNGLLSANDFEPFEGEYTVEAFLYSDSDNINGSICAIGENQVIVTFLGADDPGCDEEPGGDCAAAPLIVQGDTEICHGETTTLTGAFAPVVPPGGGFLINFFNPETEDGISWTNPAFPATFDNDLNGLLSANDFDPFEGAYEVEIFVFTNPADIAGSICDVGGSPVTITFIDPSDPFCDQDPDLCEVGPLSADGSTAACPGESITFTSAALPQVPEGGGLGIQFTHVATEDAVNWTGITLPVATDNDLNGLLSANDFDPFEGEYTALLFAYTDPNDVEGSVCSIGIPALTVFFLSADDPACSSTGDPCSVSPLTLVGSDLACPGETISLTTLTPPEVPAGGGAALIVVNTDTEEPYLWSDVDMPVTFDAGLNGALDSDGLPPLSGAYAADIIVYTDPSDIMASICAQGGIPTIFTFADEDHPDCSGAAEPCTDWVDPTPSSGYTTFNAEFDGAPCNDGTGCAFNEITAFQVWGGEAYSVNNFVAGGTYTFSICNGPDAFSWAPEFTIIAPSGAVDAFGSDTDCSITWTASESGTYLIVVNEFGNCGNLLMQNNGFPSLSCEDSPETMCPEACAAGTLIAEGGTEICPGSSVILFNPAQVFVPAEGGYLVRIEVGSESYNFEVSEPAAFLELDNTLNGLLTEPHTGEVTAVGFVFENSLDVEGTVCDETGPVAIAFLAEDDEDCLVSTSNGADLPKWMLFPNPAKEQFTLGLKLVRPEVLTLRVTDISGRSVHAEVLPAVAGRREITVDSGKLTPGVYAVTLEGEDFRDTKRLVIAR